MEIEVKTYSKMRSRTFWLAVAWSVFVPAGLVSSVLLARYGVDSSWLGNLITASGIIVAAYVGGEKLINSVKEKRNGN